MKYNEDFQVMEKAPSQDLYLQEQMQKILNHLLRNNF